MELSRTFLVAFLLVHFYTCCGFNLDLDFVDVIGTGSDSDYFGYSVLLQKGSTSSVLVGAPKSNSSYANHNNIKEPGALYRCDIGSANSCRQYVIDREGNSDFRGGDSRFNYKNRKDGGLLGATVDGGENVGDPFFVCSPRWVNDRQDRNGQHFLANGMCYRIHDSRNLNEVGEKIMPLLHSGKQGYTLDNVVKYYYAMGEVGMSIQYLNKEKILLLGAPGVLSWQGTVVQYKSTDLNNLPQQQRLVQQRIKRQITTDINIPNPVYIASLKEDNSYFGYSVSSGKFNSRYGNLWYVTGAPRAEELYGLVLLYEFSTYDDSDLRVHKKFVGDQLGAYFGAAVLGVNMRGNRGVDLLVGAPTYFTDTWDEGCVYFYKNDGQGNFENPVKIFGNKQAGARFGTTISSIGDINKDFYQDVAISAPYEEEQGVVYIYLGNRNGLSAEFSQRIVAKTINKSLRGFGFSISKGVDIDQNLYNDIAIGAYKSGHVAIVKSRPVLEYTAKLTSTVKELSVETTNFNVTYCIGYFTPTNNVNNVDTVIKIVKDPRAINSNDITQTLTLTKGNNFCENLQIALKGGNMDFTKPFALEMSYSLSDSLQNKFCSTCPVNNPADIKLVTLNIPFANGCGTDNICQPDLKVSAKFETSSHSLVIGLLTTLKLNVRIENKGEPAYLCQVHMVLPPDVEILRISSRCQLSEDRVYHCLVDNVLQPNTYRDLVFDLDIKKLNPKDKQLALNVTVDSKGDEVNSGDNSFPVILPLIVENHMEIDGQSFPEQIVYIDEEEKIKSEVVNFNHEFFIKNFGPSPLSQIILNFYFPVELETTTSANSVAFDVYEPEVYVNNQPIECTTDYSKGFFSESVEGEASDIDGKAEAKAISNRFRRDINSESAIHSPPFEVLGSPSMLLDLPINRTVFVNCSSDNIKCMHVTCRSEETINRNQFISAKFLVRAHIKVLQQILGNKDIILVGSMAETNVNNKSTQNYVQTLLIGSLIEEDVSYWIYIVCVVVALIILAILTFVLYKFNFFNRPVREKLQNASESSSDKKDLDDDEHCHANELYNL